MDNYLLRIFKLIKINYFSVFFGVFLFLEWIYNKAGLFWPVFLFFIFFLAVALKFAKKFGDFILWLAFLLSSLSLLSVYEGMAGHFLIGILTLAFLFLIFFFSDEFQKSKEFPEGEEKKKMGAIQIAGFLLVFFWFCAYFFGKFGGFFSRNFLSFCLILFLFKEPVFLFFENARRRFIALFSFGLVFTEFALVLNLSGTASEIKALIIGFAYLIMENILRKKNNDK